MGVSCIDLTTGAWNELTDGSPPGIAAVNWFVFPELPVYTT